MRIPVLGAAALVLAAVPASAQVSGEAGALQVTRQMVFCTDSPITALPTPKIVIKGIHDTENRTLAMNGPVIIGRTPDDGLAVGQRYVAHRVQGDPKAFPRPGKGYGDLLTLGLLTITAVDDINALATVDTACWPVEPGDFLEPYVEQVLPTESAAMAPPDFSDRGKVLFGINNRVVFGDGDTFSIDRGTMHGVVPGARFAIYRDQRDGMPLIYVGEVVVLLPGEQTSKVALVKVVEGVHSGDIVVPRRQP